MAYVEDALKADCLMDSSSSTVGAAAKPTRRDRYRKLRAELAARESEGAAVYTNQNVLKLGVERRKRRQKKLDKVRVQLIEEVHKWWRREASGP